MKKDLHFTGRNFPIATSFPTIVFVVFLMISFQFAGAQSKDIFVPLSQLKIVKTIKINSSRVESPEIVDPNAIYSNVTSAFGGDAYQNGGATVQAGNNITTLVADSLGLIGTPPFTIASFKFSVANINPEDVTARPRIRFYAADGAGGGPGALIAGLSFAPIVFTGTTVTTFNTGTLATTFSITTQSVWAGITFDDNTGTTGITSVELNNLGQAILNPIDKGTSGSDFFQTDDAGAFLADDPVGATYIFGDGTLANFAWELVSAIPLPVTLDNFKAQRNGLVNTLTWSTSQEFNTDHFAVERGIDGIHFSQAGDVKASGNSNTPRNYHFDDAGPAKGINYYRLRMVDINNTGKYSNVITVKNGGALNLVIYPNPAKNSLLVNIDAEKAEAAVVSIIANNGAKVYSRQVTLAQGNNNFPIDINNLSKGAYYIEVRLSGNRLTRKFNKL